MGTIRRFGMGFAPDDWRALYNHLHSLGYTPTELFDTNLVRKSEKNGKYYENSHPITAEAREDLNSTILEAYEQKLQEEQSEDQGEDLGQGQTM